MIHLAQNFQGVPVVGPDPAHAKGFPNEDNASHHAGDHERAQRQAVSR